ncbi:MAG: site-specific integrase [Gemmataceae bacterium]|nr:site-specific integrase [Gemmataceae bacterium]
MSHPLPHDRLRVPTAHAVIDQFLDHLRKRVAAGMNEPSTLAWYEPPLVQILKPLLPQDLHAAEVRPYHLLPGPLTNHFVRVARRPFTWAAEVGILDRDPLHRHKVPPAGHRERIPTLAEREAIYRHSTPWFQRFLDLLWATGARPGELRALTWECVHLDEGMAEVREYKAKKRTKDAAAVRVIYLDRVTVERLRSWREERLCTPKTLVLRNRYDDGWSRNAVVIAFRRACARAGIDQNGERLVPYSFRHGRATELTENGMTTRMLMEVLGHHQEKTTHRYQHPRKEAVLNKLNEMSAKAAG